MGNPLWRAAFAGFVCFQTFCNPLRAAEPPLPLLPLGITPPTPENVSQAARERIVRPAPFESADRLWEIGIAFGSPIVVGTEFGLQIFRRVQVGFNFAMVPAHVIPTIPLPEQVLTLADGLNYILNPSMELSAMIVSPFIRYFPTRRMFYLQATAGLYQTTHQITSDIKEDITGFTFPSALQLDATILTIFPTVSVGYFFWRHLYFLNISLGATFLLSSTSQVAVTTALPAPFDTLIGTAEETQIANTFNQQLSTAVTMFRQQLGVLPSVMISMGFMF